MTRPGHIANTLSKEGIVDLNDGPNPALTPSGAKPVSRLGASRVDPGHGDLASRCEKATEPLKPLDVAIWLAVVADEPSRKAYRAGLKISKKEAAFRASYMMGGLRYTSSMDDAMRLIPEGWTLSHLSRSDSRKYWLAFCWLEDPWQDIRPNVPDGSASTPALAMCAAALRAHALATQSTEDETQ